MRNLPLMPITMIIRLRTAQLPMISHPLNTSTNTINQPHMIALTKTIATTHTISHYNSDS